MNKVNPNDIAKWFWNKGIIENPNSKEGNMKIQKLLFFAQLIYMAENNGNTMFDEEFKAFKDGVVLENVMNNYWKKYTKMFNNSSFENLILDSKIEETLEKTLNIFGDASAQELSELSHEFDAWKQFFSKSKIFGKYDKKLSVIPYSELKKELYRIDKVLKAYELSKMYDNSEIEDY